MATCTEESVGNVFIKKLSTSFDIKNVKSVECSSDSRYLLVHKSDFTLYLVQTRTGLVYTACKDVQQFVWSKCFEGTEQNLTFSTIHSNGNVDLYEIKEKYYKRKVSTSSEQGLKERSVVNLIGSINRKIIEGFLVDKAKDVNVTNARLLCSRQCNTSDEDDYLVTLFDGFFLLTLAYNGQKSCDIHKWSEFVKHVSIVPYLLPYKAIKDVKIKQHLLFILFDIGVILIYNFTNCSFYGWIDVYARLDSTEASDRPLTDRMDIKNDSSTIYVCDVSNNVIIIRLKNYYEHFPRHFYEKTNLNVPQHATHATSTDFTIGILGKTATIVGDGFWNNEVAMISKSLQNTRRQVMTEDVSRMSSWSITIVSPPWMRNFTMHGIYCSTQSFLLWLLPKSNDSEQIANGILCCYLENKNEYSISVFFEETMVADGGDALQPVYLLTSKMIGLPVFGATQNELVNKVIMYENVSMAEKLCYLNNWDHFAVPISALEAALKHEQLDTVSFYLKNKGKMFTTIASESEVMSPMKTLSPSSFNSKQLYSKSQHYEDVLQQITNVVDLLLTTINVSSKRKHSVQFTCQLVYMSCDYINGLMKNAVEYLERQLGSVTEREKTNEVLSYLTAKTMELRVLSHTIPVFSRDENRQENITDDNLLSRDLCPETKESIFKKWSTMDDKDVIQDAVMCSFIPLAQLYFLSKENNFSYHDGSLPYFIKSGMNLVLTALIQRDIDSARELLKNMGENDIKVIKNICMKTFNRPLRDFLVEQLKIWRELNENELNAVEFLKILENVYDNSSFETYKIRQMQTHERVEFYDLGLLKNDKTTLENAERKGLFQTGSISREHTIVMASRISGGYCEVILDWVVSWDDETKQRILLEGFRREKKDIWKYVDETSYWQFLKAHSDYGEITKWISSTSGQPNDNDFPPLSFQAGSDLSQCTNFVREVVMDELSSNGLHCEEMLKEFSLLLRQLCRNNKLFDKEHPLKDITSNDRQQLVEYLRDNNIETIHSMEIFHQKMIEFCSTHGYMDLLYYYLNHYRLCETTEECRSLVGEKSNPEVTMLMQFRLAGLYPCDVSSICAMSLSNSALLLNDPKPTINAMLNANQPLMALITCLYAPDDLSKVLSGNADICDQKLWQVDETLLKSSLSPYPRLCSALFPRTRSEALSHGPDITLYELLQGNCPFDISSLFTWQTTNNLSPNNALSQEMPHFSQESLVEKFAHQETLTYTYYLKHGRPSFAFITFLCKHQHRKHIPKTSITRASNKAYHLAISHFGNVKIVNSCVAFVELLGVDTTFLRIDIETSKRILQHGNRDLLQCSDEDEFRTAIVKHLLNSENNDCCKPEGLLTVLENATRNLISKKGLDCASRQANEFWSLPILFCRFHDITLTPAFLIDCAKADKWLTFLAHAQLAQFPKNEVLAVVQHYIESNTLKEHLHQAFSNVVTVKMKNSEEEERRRKRTPVRRDVRSGYLSRVFGASGSPVSSKSSIEHASKAADVSHGDESSLVSSFSEDIQATEERRKGGRRRERKKIVGDEGENDDDNEADISSEATTSNVADINPETSPDNLFDILSLCNETTDSWQAILAHSITLNRPLFSVLAACYKDAKILNCMCAWLCSIHSKATVHAAVKHIKDVQWYNWTTVDLSSLLMVISEHGANYAHALSKMFYIFDPENLLLPFMRFFEAFLVHFDFEASAMQLSLFTTRYKSICLNKGGCGQVGDLVWCENISSGIVRNMLNCCDTIHVQVELFRLLCHCKFGNGFSSRVPNFKKIYNIGKVLQEAGVFVKLTDFTTSVVEYDRILQELLKMKKFNEAKEYSELVGICTDKISICKILEKKKSMQCSRLWSEQQERIHFWESCNRYFQEQKCSNVGHFFQDEAKSIKDFTQEKATLLFLTYEWFSKRRNDEKALSKTTTTELNELEYELWLCIICDRIKHENQLCTKFVIPPTQSNLLQKRHLNMVNSRQLSDDKMKEILQRIIGELLDSGHVTQARRLSVLFNTTTKDLDFVLTCIFLAQEMEDLEATIKELIPSEKSTSLSSSYKMNEGLLDSLSRSYDDQDELLSWSIVSDNLKTMERLADLCQSGKMCCSQVIVAYIICQTMGLKFQEVVCTDHFDLLSQLLGSSFDKRFQLAAQYIKAFNMNLEKVAQFVAKSICTSLSVYAGSEIQDDKALIFDPSSRDDMTNIMNLAEDKLMLGSVLFDETLLLARKRKTTKPNSSALHMEVELLICAHRCQTLACNTEGISSILKMAQLCTKALAENNEYQLMVRLLTGIGRFTEMTYIFQTLMEHHHFELLVKKNVENENKLKVALLNYLDKNYMGDTEKHLLVAYCFNMHREVAASLKTSADLQIQKLVKRGLGSNAETRSQLMTIAQSYTYALENFKEEGCLLQALECSKLQRLVELQTHLLPTGMVILNMNKIALSAFLAKYNNFFEAYIVAIAYHQITHDIWVEPLFNHVINGGDLKYLTEMASVIPITNTILSELVLKYRGELQRNTTAMANMKKVLRYETNVLNRYKIAMELGYRDEVESIRKNEHIGAFIRDMEP